MENFLKADRKGKAKPEIIRPADNECKTCDGNIRVRYTKMRESEEVENEILEEPMGKQRIAMWNEAKCKGNRGP